MSDKTVTLPLSPTDMVEFFKDKSQAYMVDYDKTVEQLNDRSMLLYLANLGIKASFSKVTPSLMYEYMVMKEFVDIPMLAAVHANILGYAKYQEVMFEEAIDLFDEGEIIDLALTHPDLIVDQCVFLDSFLLYMITRELAEEEEVTETDNFDDELHDTLGYSLVTLLTFQDFMIMYLREAPPLCEQTYYSRYFDDYMFKGKNLFHYAHKSPAFGLYALLRKEGIGAEDESE